MCASLPFIHLYIKLLGGTAKAVHGYAAQYIFITVAAGGLCTSLSALFSHFICAESKGLEASLGIAPGGVLNIALDLLFMFHIMAPGQEVLGAAIATALSNLISLVFFIALMIKHRKQSVLSFRPSLIRFGDGILIDIPTAGLPACIMTLCENLSYAVLDKIFSASGIMVQAGIGVAKKINMLSHSMVRGMRPLIAYNYASKNYRRMRHAVSLSIRISISCAMVCMLCYLTFSRQLIAIFLSEGSEAVVYGIKFLRIPCIGAPFSACAYCCISFFQAVGKGRNAFLLAVMRKGVLDIPMMFLLNRLCPIFGATCATPIADACYTASVIMILYFLRRYEENSSGKICYRDLKVV